MHWNCKLFSPNRIPVSFFWVHWILWIRPIKRLSSSWIVTIVLISSTVPVSSLQAFNPITGILLAWQIIMEDGTIEITSVNTFWITLNLEKMINEIMRFNELPSKDKHSHILVDRHIVACKHMMLKLLSSITHS